MEMTPPGSDSIISYASSRPAAGDDTGCRDLPLGRSLFPADANARIFRASPSVMTSGRARTNVWRLVFERRTPPFIEPLMGWTGGDDTLTQVELTFPTLDAAVAYAEQQGLDYIVEARAESTERRSRTAIDVRTFMRMLSTRLALASLQTRHGIGRPTPSLDRDKAFLDPAAVFRAPADVVGHPELSHEDKRAILKNWAWNEYLAELATAEGMPDNGAPSRLPEVVAALLELEKRAPAGDVVVLWRSPSPRRLAS